MGDTKDSDQLQAEHDRVKMRRASRKRAFTRIKNNLLRAIEDDDGVELVRGWYSELKETWANVERPHEQFVSCLPVSDSET